jgi:periplasmic glucans biosynthesis protein
MYARLILIALAFVACAAAPKESNRAGSKPKEALRMAAPAPFSFEALVSRAETLAKRPYRAPPSPPAQILERIDYEAHGKLKYKAERALFADGPGLYPVTFFHLGRYFRVPVRMHVVEASGEQRTEREIEYDASYFEMPEGSPARELRRGTGFAGLRFQESRLGDPKQLPWQKNDWVAFLGGTYFRAIGELYQYGLSARAIAIDVAAGETPEEFPTFTHLYIERPADNDPSVTLYGLFEGPSLAGAVRFVMHRQRAVVMEVTESLFLRRDVRRLGIAPLTSMYWFSEKSKDETVPDWRPEVHDSDGLALWTGQGEHIWRPLNNPPRTVASSFVDESPKGFGLSQRDREFSHYLDGVRYERRPSLWVEPLGAWGKGAVELVEIPTDDEIHDNIVAMWVPEAPARAGMRYDVRYRLHWLADEPFPSERARIVATRMGRGGEPGRPRPSGVRKFVVEMAGGALARLPYGTRPEAVLWSSRGTFSYVFTEAVPNDIPGHWRAQFDLTVEGTEPVEMRLFLRQGDQALSETWSYQWHPRP